MSISGREGERKGGDKMGGRWKVLHNTHENGQLRGGLRATSDSAIQVVVKMFQRGSDEA